MGVLGVRRESLSKMGGVVGDDRFAAGLEGFVEHRLGEIDREQGAADPAGLGRRGEQADVVPLFGEVQRRDALHRRDDFIE